MSSWCVIYKFIFIYVSHLVLLKEIASKNLLKKVPPDSILSYLHGIGLFRQV